MRIGLDKDLDGWRPEKGKTDKYGQEIEDREYNDLDFDRNLVLEKRTELVAAKITEFLKATDRFAKTIVFCENIDHAERMRQALVNANPDLAAANSKYVMRITGDNEEGKVQLDNFIDPESTFPGDRHDLAADEHRRGCANLPSHRARPPHQLDDRVQADHRPRHAHQRGLQQALLHHHGLPRATALFADPDFDGDPVQIYEPSADQTAGSAG